MKARSSFLPVIIFLSLLTFSLTGCRGKKDVECNNATLCIRNSSTTNEVYYGWGTNHVTDTLLPGDCATRENYNVSIKYDIFGQEIQRSVSSQPFYCGFTTYFEVSECYTEYDVPCSGVNPQVDCDNGIFNPESGELGFDCGGNCVPCPSYKPACFLVENKVENPISIIGTSNKLGVISFRHSGGDFGLEYRFKSEDSRLSFSFNIDEFPTESRMFEIGDKPHQSHGYYKSSIWSDYEWSTSLDQKLYLVKMDSLNWKIEFCDLIFVSNKNNSRKEAMSGSLTFKLTDF